MNSYTPATLEGPSTILKRIRPVALLIALLFALPAAAFPSFSVLFLSLGAVLGILTCVYLEVRCELKSDEKVKNQLLAELPPEYEGLASFKEIAMLELRNEPPPGQLELPTMVAPQHKTPRKTAAVVRSLEGKNLYLIDCDRFVALLLDRMTEDANKAVEHAMAMGLKRYGKAQTVSKELERFLSDSNVIEVVKSDFRGNMLMIINRAGEKSIRELIKKAQQTTKEELGHPSSASKR